MDIQKVTVFSINPLEVSTKLSINQYIIRTEIDYKFIKSFIDVNKVVFFSHHQDKLSQIYH